MMADERGKLLTDIEETATPFQHKYYSGKGTINTVEIRIYRLKVSMDIFYSQT
jgi:hypothetical protein